MNNLLRACSVRSKPEAKFILFIWIFSPLSGMLFTIIINNIFIIIKMSIGSNVKFICVCLLRTYLALIIFYYCNVIIFTLLKFVLVENIVYSFTAVHVLPRFSFLTHFFVHYFQHWVIYSIWWLIWQLALLSCIRRPRWHK